MPRSAVIAALLLCLLFGGDLVSRKALLTHVQALTSGALAYSLGAVVIGAYALLRGVPLRPRSPGSFLRHAISAGLFTLVNALSLIGLHLSTAVRGSVLFYTYPLFVMLLAAAVGRPREPLGWVRLLGAGLALCGVVVVVSRPAGGPWQAVWQGDILILGSALCLAVMLLHVRTVTQREPPVAAVFWQVGLSVPLFWLAAIWREAPVVFPVSLRALLLLAYQGPVVVGLGFVVRAELLRRHGAGPVSSFFFLTPIAGVLLGALLLREELRPQLLVGGPLVLLGVILAERGR